MSTAPRSWSSAAHHASVPPAMLEMLEMTEVGKRLTMLAKRMMEMPLPMPNSVICSPSHMMSAEPEVKVMMMTIAAQMPLPSSVSRPLFLMRI